MKMVMNDYINSFHDFQIGILPTILGYRWYYVSHAEFYIETRQICFLCKLNKKVFLKIFRSSVMDNPEEMIYPCQLIPNKDEITGRAYSPSGFILVKWN